MDCEPMSSSGIIISPSTDQKIKSRNAAMRLKHGSPQFKDVLRKRFRNRIKESRGRLFDRLRDVDVTQTKSVTTFIQRELSNLLRDKDWDITDFDEETRLKDEMENETLAEQENWLLQQYDILIADDSALQLLWEEAQLVVCPVCLKGNLKLRNDAFCQAIHCDHCSMAIPARASIAEIQDRIYVIVNNHSDCGCPHDTHFFVSNGDASLYAHCNACSFFDLV